MGADRLSRSRDALNRRCNVVVPSGCASLRILLEGAFGAPQTTGAGPYTQPL